MGYTARRLPTGETPEAHFRRVYGSLGAGHLLLDVHVRPTSDARVLEVYLLLDTPDAGVTVYAGLADLHPEPGFDLGYRDPAPEHVNPDPVQLPPHWLAQLKPLPPVVDEPMVRDARAALAHLQAQADEARRTGRWPDGHNDRVTAAQAALRAADPHHGARTYRARVLAAQGRTVCTHPEVPHARTHA